MTRITDRLQRQIDMALQMGSLKKNEDGKFYASLIESLNNPWHAFHIPEDNQCGYWHSLLHAFPSFKKQNKKWFVPSYCQECWKVVVRPRTLKELFKLEELQEKCDMPCKCGIEERISVSGLYGGYFYSRSLEEGLECYGKVKKLMDLNFDGIKVFLKRGCTEYEVGHGDSKKWMVTDTQKEGEQFIFDNIVPYPPLPPLDEKKLERIHKRWIVFAYTAGDSTYLEFSKPLLPEYRTYHHLLDKTDEEIQAWLSEVDSEEKV